jgi:Ca2+-transporting ATPase
LLSIISSGVLMFLLTFGLFAYYEKSADAGMAARAGTMAFTVFIMLQLVNAFNCRSSHLSAFCRPGANRWLLAAVLASFVLQLAIIYTPFGQGIFNAVPLEAPDWALIAGAGALMLVWEEAKKRVWMQKLEY